MIYKESVAALCSMIKRRCSEQILLDTDRWNNHGAATPVSIGVQNNITCKRVAVSSASVIASTVVHMREAGSSCGLNHSQASAVEIGVPCKRSILLDAAFGSHEGMQHRQR